MKLLSTEYIILTLLDTINIYRRSILDKNNKDTNNKNMDYFSYKFSLGLLYHLLNIENKIYIPGETNKLKKIIRKIINNNTLIYQFQEFEIKSSKLLTITKEIKEIIPDNESLISSNKANNEELNGMTINFEYLDNKYLDYQLELIKNNNHHNIVINDEQLKATQKTLNYQSCKLEYYTQNDECEKVEMSKINRK